MPRISQFFGITIAMYFNDHTPPHFHARYGDAEAAITIDTLANLYWERARQGVPLVGIEPLD